MREHLCPHTDVRRHPAKLRGWACPTRRWPLRALLHRKVGWHSFLRRRVGRHYLLCRRVGWFRELGTNHPHELASTAATSGATYAISSDHERGKRAVL